VYIFEDFAGNKYLDMLTYLIFKKGATVIIVSQTSKFATPIIRTNLNLVFYFNSRNNSEDIILQKKFEGYIPNSIQLSSEYNCMFFDKSSKKTLEIDNM